MRSARTDRPTRSAPTDPVNPALAATPRVAPAGDAPLRSPRHLVPTAAGRLGLVCSLVLVLAACASGSVEEARLGQARDAVATAELPVQQATRTAERFFPPTPTPSPTPPPIPALESLVVTLGFAGDAPQGSYASVPADAGRIYAGALLNGVAAGQVVAATLTDGAGNVVDRAQVTITAGAARQWVALPLNASLPPGEYAVYLFVGERRLNSLVFGVTAPGTGPQLFAEPPANPQAQPDAPSGQPGPGEIEPERRRDRDRQREGEPSYDEPIEEEYG